MIESGGEPTGTITVKLRRSTYNEEGSQIKCEKVPSDSNKYPAPRLRQSRHSQRQGARMWNEGSEINERIQDNGKNVERPERFANRDIHPRIKNLTCRVIKESQDWYKHTVKLLKQTTLNKNLFELYCWAARASEKSSRNSPRQSKGLKKPQHTTKDSRQIISVEGQHLETESSPTSTREHVQEGNNVLETKLKRVTRSRWKTPGEIAILVGRERNKTKASNSEVPLTLQCFASEMQRVWKSTTTTSYINSCKTKAASVPSTPRHPGSNPKVYHPETREVVRLSQLLGHRNGARNQGMNPEGAVGSASSNTYDFENALSADDLEHYLAVNRYIKEHIDHMKTPDSESRVSKEIKNSKTKKSKLIKKTPRYYGWHQKVSGNARDSLRILPAMRREAKSSQTGKLLSTSSNKYPAKYTEQIRTAFPPITPIPPRPPPCSPTKAYTNFMRGGIPLDEDSDEEYPGETEQDVTHLDLPLSEGANSLSPCIDTFYAPSRDCGSQDYVLFQSEDIYSPEQREAPIRLILRLPRQSLVAGISSDDDLQTENIREEGVQEAFLPPMHNNINTPIKRNTPADSGIITPLNTPHASSSCSPVSQNQSSRKSSVVKLPNINVNLAF